MRSNYYSINSTCRITSRSRIRIRIRSRSRSRSRGRRRGRSRSRSRSRTIRRWLLTQEKGCRQGLAHRREAVPGGRRKSRHPSRSPAGQTGAAAAG